MYILGAGSSKCANGPLISEFKDAARRVLDDPGVAWGEDGSFQGTFEAAYNTWVADLDSYNIEELYVLADLGKRMKNASRHRPVVDEDDVQYLICKTMHYAMRGGTSATHRRFVQRTRPRNDSSVIVITLNWDITVDNAVRDVLGEQALDYAYPRCAPRTDRAVERDPVSYKLLKLHGSMNWWYCRKCRSVWYDDDKTLVQHWEKRRGRRCPRAKFQSETRCEGAELTPAMVPPTSQKMERNGALSYLLRSIWREARTAVMNCDRLVIAGYSFPPTDIQFKMFVVEALLQNRTSPPVAVVTKASAEQRSEVETKFTWVVRAARSSEPLQPELDGFEAHVARLAEGGTEDS